MEIKKFIEENESRFLDELFSLIRIPSISSQKSHKQDMLTCAERIGRITKRFFNGDGQNGESCLFIGSYKRRSERGK